MCCCSVTENKKNDIAEIGVEMTDCRLSPRGLCSLNGEKEERYLLLKEKKVVSVGMIKKVLEFFFCLCVWMEERWNERSKGCQ